MSTTLQELTEKIYAEGVEKGNQEATQIVANAKDQAEQILAKAKSQAESIVAGAKKTAEELKQNTQSELKLFAQQSLNALKTEVTNLICGEIVNTSVKAANADGKFMQTIIAKVVDEWIHDGGVEIQAKDAKALTDYFEANAKGLLEKGLKITEVKGLKTDFAITPANGAYKITFGDAEFEAYFKEFLRPKLIEMLFGAENK